MWDPYAEFESTTLPNGLTVHAAHWPKRPWESVGFLIHSGAASDPVGLEGLAHFVEHVVSGNLNISTKDLRDFFSNCGGSANLGSTGFPFTKYNFFVPVKKAILAKAFSFFGQMLTSVKLKKYIERERQVIIGEFYRRYPNKIWFDLDMRERKALYSSYWLERFAKPLGSPESVRRIVQNDLQSHYDALYVPANISIVGVGGLKLPELADLLLKSPFAVKKKGSRAPVLAPIADASLPFEARHIFEMSKHMATASQFEVGAYQSFARMPGNANIHTIQIMRQMFNEILNNEVREQRAWAYAIESFCHNFLSFHQFLIECNALAIKALDEIDEVVEACIASMSEREDLFERVKRQILSRTLMADPNGQGLCGCAIEDLVQYQRIISFAEYREDIKRITMSDVRSLLQYLRPERRWTLITKP